jgi:hypothetical protein
VSSEETWPGVDLTDPRITRVAEGFDVSAFAGIAEIRFTGATPYPWSILPGPCGDFFRPYATAGDAIDAALASGEPK